MVAGNGKNDGFILTSMTDLMTSLAVIFILLLVVYLNKTYIDTSQKSKDIKGELAQLLEVKNIKAEDDPLDPLSLIIRLHDDKLSFNIDRAEIKSDGRTFLQTFIPNLTEVLCSNKDEVESVLVQGFTDSKTGNYQHNLELSQRRAFNVLMYAVNDTPLSKDLKTCLLGLTSTNGKGSRDLLPFNQIKKEFSEPGYENEELSRRVEFKIRVKSYEQREKVEEVNKSSTETALASPEPEETSHISENIAEEVIENIESEYDSILSNVDDSLIKSAKIELNRLLKYKQKIKTTWNEFDVIAFDFEKIKDREEWEKAQNLNFEKASKILSILNEYKIKLLNFDDLDDNNLASLKQSSLEEIKTLINDVNDLGNKSQKFFTFLVQNNHKFKNSSDKLKLKGNVDDKDEANLQEAFNVLLKDYESSQEKLIRSIRN